MELDLIEKQLLNQIQQSVPLTGRPFRDLGYKISLDEDELIRRIVYLKEIGILRWMGALVDWRKLGFQSTLVAMDVPPERLEAAAEVINKNSGVSHNYTRTHQFNLWFTLAVPPKMDLCGIIEELTQQVGSRATLNLPATRTFKIRAFFDVLGDGNGQEAKETPCPPTNGGSNQPYKPTIVDFGILKELQDDLPLKRRPFDQMARRMDIYLQDFLVKSKELMDKGVIRRFSGLVNHRRAGFAFNAMSCWIVPQDKVEALASKANSVHNITHCYERASNGVWPYNIYAMIHGHTQEECEKTAVEISNEIGLPEYLMLYSTKEYKKERVAWLG